MFNLTQALEDGGHEVIPFSIRYMQNRPSPYAEYFVPPLAGEEEVYYKDQTFTPGAILKTLSRLFYAFDVELGISKLVSRTQPNVAYVLHYLRKLSPSLLVGLRNKGIPIAVRLSDYAMVCPQSHMLRNEKPCNMCLSGDLWPSVCNRCVQASRGVSAINMVATWYHKFRGFFDLIDIFVSTNVFMTEVMLSAGYSPDRLATIPTFVDLNLFYPEQKDGYDPPYIVYVGRMESIKGVHVLLDAWRKFREMNPKHPLSLRIVGFGDDVYTKSILNMCSELDKVEFLGKLETFELAKLLRGAFLSVIPSLCYENLPNSLLESYASGTPVLASNLGSITSSVSEGETGFLFEKGNSDHLAERIEYCVDNPTKVSEMALKARYIAETKYSSKEHISKLVSLFIQLTR